MPGYDLWIERRGRHWAVHEGDVLVCLCVYRKGAVEVVRRLAERNADGERLDAGPKEDAGGDPAPGNLESGLP
jgi:hypothetical protein